MEPKCDLHVPPNSTEIRPHITYMATWEHFSFSSLTLFVSCFFHLELSLKNLQVLNTLNIKKRFHLGPRDIFSSLLSV